MFVSWSIQLLSELPNRHFPGKTCRICSFGKFSSVLALIVSLGFASFGLCHDFSMVSAPLGFEICGFDRTKNWVSENGVFEFGFFEKDDTADVDGFVVGIRYKLGFKAANLPVWTVGGGLRVSMNSTFRLSMDGRLVLFENPSGLIVWSSNTSNLGVQKATLLNNGDFVLMGVDDKVLWESFNSPTNTLLPGQSFHYPQNLRAPSKKPISSYYNFIIRRSGELALVWEDNVTYWRTHLSSSAIVEEARFDGNGVLGLYNDTDKAVWSVSSKDFGDPLVSLRHLRIDQDGNLRIYSWDESLRSWRAGWQAVEDQCNVFGFCGLYSVCGYNSTGPVCNCLYSDSVQSGTDPGGSLCNKMVDLDNCKMRTSMVAMTQTVLYGLYPPHDFDILLSEESCKEYCSNDTSCIAVTSKNDGSGLCTVKQTSFISGLATPYVPSTSFLKVCFVPQAVSAHGANRYGNSGSISLPLGRVKARRESGKRFIGAIAVIAFVTVTLILTFEIFAFWFINRRRKIKDRARIPFGKDDKMNPHYSAVIRLSFEEIKELTTNFTVQLGPSVYKGLLPNKTLVVAKVINSAMVTEKEFRVVVSTLGGTHHRNLVALKGFCFEPKRKVLLYEYVPNGSLDNWLFNIKTAKNEGKNWQKRLEITLGIVRALAYLHTECQKCITHGNLKLENVLLDENLVPKVTDFGLQSLLQKEAASSSSSSMESPSEKDIYMLGEMLLQIVLCKRDIVVDNIDRVISEFNQEHECMASDNLEGVERTVRIALWCMHSQSFSRPSIGEVVKVLEGTLSVDRPPLTLAIRHNDTMEIESES